MPRILISAVVILMAMASHRIHAQKNTAYCWSSNGTEIREKPSGKAASTGSITYMAPVTVIDTLFDMPYTDTLYKSIPIHGWWLKIQQGTVAGYAFSGYLSLIPVQTFDQFFNGLTEVVSNTTVVSEGVQMSSKRHAFNRPDGSFYSYTSGDGCWDYTYFIKGGTLNDGLMLISTTAAPEKEFCNLLFTKTEGNKYYFPDCEASQDRMLEVTGTGVIYTTYSCD